MSSSGSSRGNPAMGDVLRTVAVLGVIVLGLWGIGLFFTVTPETPVETVDYAEAVESARPVAEFPLLAPESLPDGWRATSARFEPSSWHLGVLTDDDEYIGLEQVTSGAAAAVSRFAEGSEAAGDVEIDGETWQRRTGPKGRTTLVREADGVTTLINASAPFEEVERYVSSLSAS
jgi:hypothetical protein